MIDQLINKHRLKRQSSDNENNGQQVTQAKKQQTVEIFRKDEFFLIAVINLILATVRLSIFNIFFLLTFITSCLKFYKTYLMEKHIDEIEIAPFQMNHKNSSIFIHYLAKFISDVLTEKDLKKNIFLCVLVIVGYLIFRFISLHWILMMILDFEYLYCLKKRWSQNKQALRKRQILENLMSSSKKQKPKSLLLTTKSTNPPSYYPPHYPYQNLRPIGESFGEVNMQKSIESVTSQNFISQKDIQMSMIEEQQQSQKFQFEQQLPQSSSEKIKMIGHKNSIKQNDHNQQKKNVKRQKMVQHKQSLIEIKEDLSLSLEVKNQEKQQQKTFSKNELLRKKRL